ncbi:MAG: cohesin domain-containing protein [Dehalococcoidia bacterium]
MTIRQTGIIGLLVASLVLIACGQGAEPEPLGVVVELDPPSIQAGAGEEIVITVRVDPKDEGISGGEINLAFDPNILTVVGLEPGGLFGPTPLVGAELVDAEAGTLTYALARIGATSPHTPAGAFARITFEIADAAPEGRHELAITRMGLANEVFQDILEIDLQSAVITVGR